MVIKWIKVYDKNIGCNEVNDNDNKKVLKYINE